MKWKQNIAAFPVPWSSHALEMVSGFENRLSNLFNHTICKPIAQPIVRINNIFVRHYPFYSSVRTAKQTAQIIYSPVGTVCPSVRNSYSSVRTADQTVQIIYSPVRPVRQTVRTLQGPFVNRLSSVRFCRSNGFPSVSVLPFTVTNRPCGVILLQVIELHDPRFSGVQTVLCN